MELKTITHPELLRDFKTGSEVELDEHDDKLKDGFSYPLPAIEFNHKLYFYQVKADRDQDYKMILEYCRRLQNAMFC